MNAFAPYRTRHSPVPEVPPQPPCTCDASGTACPACTAYAVAHGHSVGHSHSVTYLEARLARLTAKLPREEVLLRTYKALVRHKGGVQATRCRDTQAVKVRDLRAAITAAQTKLALLTHEEAYHA